MQTPTQDPLPAAEHQPQARDFLEWSLEAGLLAAEAKRRYWSTTRREKNEAEIMFAAECALRDRAQAYWNLACGMPGELFA